MSENAKKEVLKSQMMAMLESGDYDDAAIKVCDLRTALVSTKHYKQSAVKEVAIIGTVLDTIFEGMLYSAIMTDQRFITKFEKITGEAELRK